MQLSVNKTWDGRMLAPAAIVQYQLSWSEDGLMWTFNAPFYDDSPPDLPAGSCWGLWDYEVVELFIRGDGEPAPYTEIEVGPAGHYLVLQLLGERNIVAKELPLDVEVGRDGGRWYGRVCIPRTYLPGGPLWVNGYAIHGSGKARSYSVSTVLGGKEPDFHRISNFQLRLDRA